jgi:hypothetical protein
VSRFIWSLRHCGHYAMTYVIIVLLALWGLSLEGKKMSISEGLSSTLLAFAALSSGGKNLSISEGLFYVRTKGFPFVQTY